jgi:hypothetical protein
VGIGSIPPSTSSTAGKKHSPSPLSYFFGDRLRVFTVKEANTAFGPRIHSAQREIFEFEGNWKKQLL